MRYRRDRTQGATYFFTLVTLGRVPWLVSRGAVEQLRQAFRAEMVRRPFVVDAIVIMPDHLHAIWSLPQGEADYAMRWRNIKRAFTASIPPAQRPGVFASRQHKGEQAIWQRRYWEHRIRDEKDFARHVDYIHYNPIKHGYVIRSVDWPYSSIHRYIRQSVLTPDWGYAPVDIPEGIGHE